MPQGDAQDQINEYMPGLYTTRELNQQTSYVMDQIEKNGPALITRHGRFVAMITPLKGNVESRVLAEMTREIRNEGSFQPPV